METIESRIVSIRKPRKCWGCAIEFPKGSNLNRCANKDGGEITVVHFCATCSEWFCRYDNGEGVEFGQLVHDEDWLKIKQEFSKAKELK